MECISQRDGAKCSEECLVNEDTIYKELVPDFPWISIVKNYIMHLKCVQLCSSFMSGLTKISHRAIFISAFLFLTILVSNCRKNIFHQDFKNCRLFPQHSIVKDYSYGESDLLHVDLISSDLSFVVYYAPWDHDSNQFKSIFYKAAVHFHEQITFASINCWYPDGMCKKTENLVKFPVVVLHARLPSNKHVISIPYHGPAIQSHVHRFLNRALKPISYISSRGELEELELQYQAVVLGCFSDKVPSDLYNFYYASLIHLQFSYMSDVAYAAAYNVSLCGGMHQIKLISWNKTVNFRPLALYEMKEIVHFVQRNIFLSPKFLPVHEYRSTSLSSLAAEGPLLVAFIPDDPSSMVNEAYLTLRSIVLEYMNCKNSSKMAKQIENLPFLSEKKTVSIEKFCTKHAEKTRLASRKSNFIFTDSWCEHAIENNSNQCNMYGSSEYCLLDEELWFGKNGLAKFPLLRNIGYYYRSSLTNQKNDNRTSSNSCKDYVLPPTSGGPVTDDNVALATKWYLEDQCGNVVSKSATKRNAGAPGKISGLGCSSNRSLSVVALNSLQKADFKASTPGGPPFGPTVWIVDSLAEEAYHLERWSRAAVVDFIHNYTHGLLTRKPIGEGPRDVITPVGGATLVELTAANYVNVTQHPDSSYVVLHYAHYCGACKSIGAVFLQCARLLESVPHLTFARIDVSTNNLPWHLTFTRIPQIIFHPARKKSETAVLDPTAVINVGSLLSFLLSNIDPKLRAQFACAQRGILC